MPTRSHNQSSSSSSGVPFNIDEPSIVPDAQNLTQLIQENMVAVLAPSDVNSKNVHFELIANNTIILHESHVSSDKNDLFNSHNLSPMNSPVSQMQSSDHVDSRFLARLVYQNEIVSL